MKLQRWMATLGLAALLLAIGLACSAPAVSFLAEAATPTAAARPTRTPRPTFTSVPDVTDTPVATDTAVPTDTPQPTDVPPTPTKKPVVKATAKPVVETTVPQPTNPPQPTEIPPTPKPSYMWSYAGGSCEHSGGVYLKVRAYTDRNDPSSNIDGVRIRGSYAPDGPSIGDVFTEGGEATFVLSTDGKPPKLGTWYVWVIDKQGNRFSDVSATWKTNGDNEDKSDTCWLVHISFVKN